MAVNFWGDDEVETGEYESKQETKEFSVIPDKTKVSFYMDEVKLDEYMGEKFINTRWVISAPAEFKNRKIFHKVKLWNIDQKKAEKAAKLIKAIDVNCGGKLRASGLSPDDWDDDLLSKCLLNHEMLGTLGVWDFNDRQGNWIMAVSPKVDAVEEKPKANKPKETYGDFKDDDLSIPF